MTGLPTASARWVLISGAAMSVPPPAGKQTIMVICRSGYSARALCEIASVTAIAIRAADRRRALCAARDITDIGLSSKAWFYLSRNYDRPEIDGKVDSKTTEWGRA